MTSKAEERAEQYAFLEIDLSINEPLKLAYLAGHQDFITNELPALLEMARLTYWPVDDFNYTIEQILQKAREG